MLSEPVEGSGRRELAAAASSQKAERGVSVKAVVLFTRLSREQQLTAHKSSRIVLSLLLTPLLIQAYTDRGGRGGSPSEGAELRAFVDGMLQDVRSSYRAREEQLAAAARSYKKRLQKITTTHRSLLIAYRYRTSFCSTNQFA